jgi:imidazolonepropionase-like amidohydrolase
VLVTSKYRVDQNRQLVALTKWFTPAEILRMATSVNAEHLQLFGDYNPYPGRLGVVEEGALADLLLVKGNPLEIIELLTDPSANLAVIMKNGKIYKDVADRL